MKRRPLQYIDFRRSPVGAGFFTVGPLVELSRYRDRRPEGQRNVHREQLHRVPSFVTNNSHDQIVFGRGSSVPSSYVSTFSFRKLTSPWIFVHSIVG